ncbi:hypothetical protein JCM19379_17350 [Methyloparacoccus murrellii]
MSIARILIITLLISLSLVVLVLFNLESDSGDQDGGEAVATAPKSSEAPDRTPAAGPVPPAAPSGDELMAPDEAVEDEQLEKEQIAEAMTQLGSTNDEERIEAVEQLGAYPSPETEATLGQLLTTDGNPEVRNAAALSLGAVDEPSDATVAALMSALEDQNEDVRFSALSTLEDYMLGQEEDSPNYRRIKDGLKFRLNSRTLSAELRESINEVLRDQDFTAAPEAEPDN